MGREYARAGRPRSEAGGRQPKRGPRRGLKRGASTQGKYQTKGRRADERGGGRTGRGREGPWASSPLVRPWARPATAVAVACRGWRRRGGWARVPQGQEVVLGRVASGGGRRGIRSRRGCLREARSEPTAAAAATATAPPVPPGPPAAPEARERPPAGPKGSETLGPRLQTGRARDGPREGSDHHGDVGLGAAAGGGRWTSMAGEKLESNRGTRGRGRGGARRREASRPWGRGRLGDEPVKKSRGSDGSATQRDGQLG